MSSIKIFEECWENQRYTAMGWKAWNNNQFSNRNHSIVLKKDFPDIQLPDTFLGKGEYYALKVTGDSMIDDGILENDTIIIDNKKTPKNGDVVVAYIDDEEVTLKKFRKKGDSIALEPANKNYKTHIYGPDRVKIQGVLTSLIRLY